MGINNSQINMEMQHMICRAVRQCFDLNVWIQWCLLKKNDIYFCWNKINRFRYFENTTWLNYSLLMTVFAGMCYLYVYQKEFICLCMYSLVGFGEFLFYIFFSFLLLWFPLVFFFLWPLVWGGLGAHFTSSAHHMSHVPDPSQKLWSC